MANRDMDTDLSLSHTHTEARSHLSLGIKPVLRLALLSFTLGSAASCPTFQGQSSTLGTRAQEPGSQQRSLRAGTESARARWGLSTPQRPPGSGTTARCLPVSPQPLPAVWAPVLAKCQVPR